MHRRSPGSCSVPRGELVAPFSLQEADAAASAFQFEVELSPSSCPLIYAPSFLQILAHRARPRSTLWQVLAGGSHTGPVHREPLAGGVSLGQEQECGEPANTYARYAPATGKRATPGPAAHCFSSLCRWGQDHSSSNPGWTTSASVTSGKCFPLPQDGQSLPHGITMRGQGLHTR